jgi:LytS/YehU family sensor histidine kinase
MEQIRFDNKFEYYLDIDSDINASQIFIPTMLLQPYIENSIHHGLNRKLGKGMLILKIIKHSTNQIEIQIEDDGIGRASALKIKAEKSVKNKSMGMNITQNRLHLIQQVFGLESKVHIEDLVDPNGEPSGTKVTLILPYITYKNKDTYEQGRAEN